LFSEFIGFFVLYGAITSFDLFLFLWLNALSVDGYKNKKRRWVVDLSSQDDLDDQVDS